MSVGGDQPPPVGGAGGEHVEDRMTGDGADDRFLHGTRDPLAHHDCARTLGATLGMNLLGGEDSFGLYTTLR